MKRTGPDFEAHIGSFPEQFRSELKAKLGYKKALERDGRLTLLPRIWLAFLTPPFPAELALIPPSYRAVRRLKETMLESFTRPRLFIATRDPRHPSSECVTLALIETLFDLEEHKILLSRPFTSRC